jgi:hypothetical protein
MRGNREVVMNIEFVNPGADHMVESILGFQTEEATSFWTDPLFGFILSWIKSIFEFFYRKLSRKPTTLVVGMKAY